MTLHPIEVVILPDGRMDRKNAALYLGLAVRTLAMHATRGTGPSFIKRGRALLFPRRSGQLAEGSAFGGLAP